MSKRKRGPVTRRPTARRQRSAAGDEESVKFVGTAIAEAVAQIKKQQAALPRRSPAWTAVEEAIKELNGTSKEIQSMCRRQPASMRWFMSTR